MLRSRFVRFLAMTCLFYFLRLRSLQPDTISVNREWICLDPNVSLRKEAPVKNDINVAFISVSLWSENTVTGQIFPTGSWSQSGALEMKCLKGVWFLSVSQPWWSVWSYSAHSPCCTKTSLLKPGQAPGEHQKKHSPWEKCKEGIEGGEITLNKKTALIWSWIGQIALRGQDGVELKTCQ